MTEAADLEIGLHRREDAAYSLELRFSQPESGADVRLGQTSPVTVQFQMDKLESLVSDPKAYGEALSQNLFADPEAKIFFAQARTQAQAFRRPLRLRLLIGPTALELQKLKWETLRRLEDGEMLCTDENLLFSRYMSSVDWRPVQPNPKGELSALVAVANPKGLADIKFTPVDVEGEMSRAKLGLGLIPMTELPNPKAAGRATLDNLIDALRKNGDDILYLVCHGAIIKDKPWLWMENDQGEIDQVLGSDLITRLKEIPRMPQLIVLGSCQSAGKGEGDARVALGPRLVEAGVPAVVAMQGNISIETLALLMPVFFQEVQTDGMVDRAMAVARRTARERPDWWMPVLFSHLKENRLLIPQGVAARVIERKPFEPETVLVPAGDFLMGNPPGPGVPGYETPQHRVNLPAYRIGKYPVTNRQYAEFIRQTQRLVPPEAGWEGQNPPANKLNHPVMGVSFYDALDYCNWLNQQTGRKYCLPNEAQWEKAARGTDGRKYPWGDDWDPARGNHSSPQITPVDQFPAQSIYDCYDMAGNLREWTCSLWGSKRLEPDPVYRYPWADDERNDPEANRQLRRVYRGGSAADDISQLTCSARNAASPETPGPPFKRHGFRLIMEI